MTAAISAHGLSKHYRLGQRQPGRFQYTALRDVVSDAFRRSRRLVRPRAREREPATDTRELWALRDVSFDVSWGEVLGVIGRNGAGKSTLLKILSRITRPTEGYAELEGRVGSLLEVGTGFHPELTGRENIYLNGAIIGMRKVEIDRQFDAIVAFAELERFLDTPVKRYSSGMYMRLAFSVAAHLEPEILLVDEVLAVGDAAFQKKCLGKMENVAHEGRTVLLVSHNMAAVQSLCSRVLLLEGGAVAEFGKPADVVGHYLQSAESGAGDDVQRARERFGNRAAEIRAGSLRDESGARRSIFRSGEPFAVRFRFHAERPLDSWYVAIGIRANDMTVVAAVNTRDLRITLAPLTEGLWEAHISVASLRLIPGHYWVGFGVCDGNGEPLDYIEDALDLEIMQTPIYGTRELHRGWGVVVADWTFDVNPVDKGDDTSA